MSPITLTLDPRNRRQVAKSIDTLINLLDQLDPDPELEATGDEEPSLGWTIHGVAGGRDDREDDPAEAGIADSSAMIAEDFAWRVTPIGDGSGRRIARRMLTQLVRRRA